MKDRLKRFIARLSKFENFVKKTPEIIGCMYLGSLGKGTFDEFSDYDVAVISDTRNLKKVKAMNRKLILMIGKIKFLVSRNDKEENQAHISDNYYKVDFEILDKSETQPDLRYKDIKIVKDKDNFLKNLKKASQKIKSRVMPKEEFRKRILQFREGQLYVARHFARGLKFSAMSDVNYQGGLLFKLLAEVKGMKDYELLRNAEKVLTAKEKKLLKEGMCHSSEKKEIMRAMKAIWKLVKHTENEYEKSTGKKLNLGVNDSEILNLASKIYEMSS